MSHERYDWCLPDLETERLFLRQRKLEDLEAIFSYASLPEVSNPAGFPLVRTLEEERVYLTHAYPKRLQEQNLPSGYGITLKGENRVIGSIDFNRRHEDDVWEIGYILHPDYWNQGIMTEAGQAFVRQAFEDLGLHKLEIACFDYNKGSRRIAEKLGFTLEAAIRDRKDSQGNRCADLRYGLLKSEWKRRNHATSP